MPFSIIPPSPTVTPPITSFDYKQPCRALYEAGMDLTSTVCDSYLKGLPSLKSPVLENPLHKPLFLQQKVRKFYKWLSGHTIK